MTRTRRLPSEVEEALWQLVAAGRVTADSFEAPRYLIKGNSNRGRRSSRLRRSRAYHRPRYSRWSLLEAVNSQAETVEPKARQLLSRYGIFFPELLAREPMAPRWRDLVRILRRLEARGEIRGGRFVAGFVGEQFALPEAVDSLHTLKNGESEGEMVAISACDPLNLVGILMPGERVAAVLGNRVVFKDGVPICSIESGKLVVRARVEEDTLVQARSLLPLRPAKTPRPVLVGARAR